MKPIIGVMPLWDDEKESIWMLPGYLKGIQQAGGIPIIFPLSTNEAALKELTGICDGFLFTGGHDVNPEIYHEEPLDGLVSCCKERDLMEAVVLDEAIRADKPLLGICRGIQFINARLGGTLYQDIPTQHHSEIEHHQRPPYSAPVHDVILLKDAPLFEHLKMDCLPVNSCHHQAVKSIAPGLKAMAVSPDGLAEALYMPGHRFLWAVQWHPEFSYMTESSKRIFGAFIKAIAKKCD